MITRLYVNNFRCLVAFDMKFDALEVLCGANGTGKSSVFDAVKFICDLAIGRCFFGGQSGDISNRTVTKLELCHWLGSTTQEFELELKVDNHDFKYVIHIEQAPLHEPRIIKEMALCDNRELYRRDLDGVHFDQDRGFPLDWRQAALSSIQPVRERQEIEILQKALSNVLIIRPSVRNMEFESKAENKFLNFDLSNVISWYRHLVQDQENTDLFRESLRGLWPDLKHLKLDDAGMSKILELHFEGVVLPFSGLSDGEKMLVSLYMVHSALAKGNIASVFIDEPDNYISLQELQPWLLSMSEITDNLHQAILISHNSEILDNNPSKGIVFLRDNHKSPTRAVPLNVPEGMSAGEALARGWVG
ncbi:MAG: ATP-binding protein [Treponema sp.]|jgi:energy-coupling factor transporter ATP-binding protein EcfA2|nr:ATP-binding protein [Treponema sp.]